MIYFIRRSDGTGPIKIGRAIDVERRLAQLRLHYGQPLMLLATMEGGRQEEREIHARFASLRMGRTEQFQPAPELLAFIDRPASVESNHNTIEAMEPAKKSMPIPLDPEIHRLLRAVAGMNGVSMSAYIHHLVVQRVLEEAQLKGIYF